MPVGLMSIEEEFSFWIDLSNPLGTSWKTSVVESLLLVSGTVSALDDSLVVLQPGWWSPVQDSIGIDS